MRPTWKLKLFSASLANVSGERARVRTEAGQVIALFAVGMLFFVAMIVVVGDNVLVRMQERNLQNSADAAAMAGIQELPHDPTEAEQKAIQYAKLNISNLQGEPQVEILDGNTKVRVTVSKHSGALFGGAFTLGNPIVTKVAAAALETTLTGFGVVLLDESACPGLYIDSHAEINVVGGGVYVNSANCSQAIRASSNSEINADFISVMSSSSVSGGCSHYNPCPVSHHPSPIPDPFADVQIPPFPTSGAVSATTNPTAGNPGWTGSGSRSGSCTSPGNEVKFSSGTWTLYPGFYNCKLFFDGGQATFQPGTYTFAGGFEINSDARVTWEHGIYVTMRTGFEMNSGARLTGNNILLYNTCHNLPCTTTGKIYLDSNAQFNATPYGDPYANIVMWQDRNSTRMLELNSNTGTGIIGGAIYAPKAKVYSDSNMTTPLQLVAGSAEFNSNATLDLTITPMNTHIETTRWAMVE